ncbi:hypothetical protein HPP92_015024 [Vanilla planifolia]|uniref:Proliferating cell nuclear antigen PCNA N-terminal domain-containing protein n=1 Tax=Vanilla planifolia TaxID=51239 RepID=A0A835QVN7_VANPL|nr:hypothetical protein HPP92_015024 [Vanilla planifolia]
MGFALQAMDSSHVALAFEQYRSNLSLGMNLNNMSKMLSEFSTTGDTGTSHIVCRLNKTVDKIFYLNSFGRRHISTSLDKIYNCSISKN